ncbi:MAG: DUF4442 domain-containing protein, partial [Pseudobdellovibrio sp.]
MSKLQHIKNNLFLSAFAWSKIPLIGFCGASVIENSDARTIIKIPLGWKTKNHLRAMYFGALSVGADLCVGLVAMRKIQQSGVRIDLLFKDFKANFLKRAEGDVHFICEETPLVAELIEQVKQSDERFNQVIKAYAIVPSISMTEKVAE